MKLYTRNHCSACITAKRLLAESTLGYEVINIEDHPDAAMYLVNEGIRTVPVMEDTATGDRFVGGAAIQQRLA